MNISSKDCERQCSNLIERWEHAGFSGATTIWIQEVSVGGQDKRDKWAVIAFFAWLNQWKNLLFKKPQQWSFFVCATARRWRRPDSYPARWWRRTGRSVCCPPGPPGWTWATDCRPSPPSHGCSAADLDREPQGQRSSAQTGAKVSAAFGTFVDVILGEALDGTLGRNLFHPAVAPAELQLAGRRVFGQRVADLQAVRVHVGGLQVLLGDLGWGPCGHSSAGVITAAAERQKWCDCKAAGTDISRASAGI